MSPRARAATFCACLGCAAYELVEVAFLAARGAVLDQQGQTTLIELAEPFLPRDLFQRILPAVSREIDANHAYVFGTAGSTHAGRLASPFFGPPPDFFVIGERVS